MTCLEKTEQDPKVREQEPVEDLATVESPKEVHRNANKAVIQTGIEEQVKEAAVVVDAATADILRIKQL
jgi:hypothetical protein